MRKYELAVGNCEESLKEAVNALIAQGYVCKGGVAVSTHALHRHGEFPTEHGKTVYVFAQAMNKDEA